MPDPFVLRVGECLVDVDAAVVPVAGDVPVGSWCPPDSA